MVTDKQFDNLVDICQSLANSVENLVDRVQNLESIARHQEAQINTLQEEVLRLNGIVDTW